MVDIVEEEVELHLVDTSQLVEEAKKLKEAQRIKKQNDKIIKSRQKVIAKGVSPFGVGKRGDALPKALEKAQTRKGAITGQKTGNAFTAMQKKLKELEKKQKKAIKKIDDFQDKFVDKLEGAQSFLTSGSISSGALGLLGGIASRFGPIGIAIASLVSVFVSGFFDQFERGGIFSTKLPITEREKNIVDINYVIDVRSGTKFLTSDLRIVQKAPDTSNTLNLQYEHVRYVSQELGR